MGNPIMDQSAVPHMTNRILDWFLGWGLGNKGGSKLYSFLFGNNSKMYIVKLRLDLVLNIISQREWTSGEAGHCILVLSSHRKKRESARKARERPIRTKMEGHIPRSKLSWLTLEAFWLVSLTIMLRKPYLRGEMYWNHPIQLGKLAVFLNTPEKMKIGRMTIGVTAELAFSSFTMLPMNNPSDPPAKPTSRLMKLKRKNCYAVEAWPTIQQMMQLKIKGMTTTQGSSTMFLLKKYGRTPYSLEFSSFRKTSFSEGNTRVTGDSEAIICEMDKKKKQPTMEYQLTVSVQLCLPALKQSPPVQMARNIDWKMRLLRIMGFLTVLMRSLLRSSLKEEEADTLSESLTSTSPVCAWSICFSISGEMCVLQVQKQKGKLYLLLQFQRCIESMKNQAGFISYGILLPSLLEKQSIP